MNNEPVAWKAYEEVNFSDQYILRWVREGDEYVNRITKEMIEDFKAVVRQQQAEIEALKKRCLDEIFNRTYADRSAEVMCEYWELAQAEVDGLKVRIERMIEKASHHEALAHAGGFEAGRQQGFFDRGKKVARQIDNNEYHTPED